MTNLRFSARQVHTFIKAGNTPEDLCERYSCTEEDIKSRLLQLYHQPGSSKGQEMYAALEANRKVARRKTTKETPAPEVSVNSNPSLPETTAEIQCEPNPAPLSCEATSASSSSEPLENPPSIEELQLEEKILSDTVIALDTEHKNWQSEYHARKKALRELQDKIEQIKESLESCRADYDHIIEEANDLAQKMNQISEARRAKLVALEAVRQKLEELESVTLYVYADGCIESQDHPEAVLKDKGYLTLVKELTERPECYDLRIRDIQTLARLIKISENVKKLILVCEINELETAFNAIKGV